MIYIVCTLNGRFDGGKWWRSSLAVHLSGFLGDHFRVVVVIQEVVASRISCTSSLPIRSMHVAAHQQLCTAVQNTYMFLRNLRVHAYIYQRPILTATNETLFPQQHLSFARERAETFMPCKQSSTCAAEQVVRADMACVTSVEYALA